ncbi:MAG: hypothetical protein WD404_05195 [Solirubrobacterales bacterium]
MTRTSTAQKIARRSGLVAAVASLALMVAPASGLAQAPVKFGAKLNPTVQPSNSLPAHPCTQEAPGKPCTMVLNDAYGRAGVERAPKSGTIKRIRVIAGGPGSFRLQLARVRKADNAAKVLRNGPKIAYTGQSEANWESDSYRVETFKVNVPVKKGEQLALRGNYTSMVRCSSGGDNTLVYQAPLRPKSPFQALTDGEGCWLLMEAVVR